MKKILFIIDKIELKYFEFNNLVTNFWLIKEFLDRGNEVYVSINSLLSLKGKKAFSKCYRSFLENNNIFYDKNIQEKEIDNFDLVLFRPDPPVDIDYINATYIFDFVTTKVVNSPMSIRNFNEKLHSLYFEEYMTNSIVTSSLYDIEEFLFENKQIVLKPLNRCFGSGVMYLYHGDPNTRTIINTLTNNETSAIMIQKFIPNVKNGDIRVLTLGNKILPYSIKKLPSGDDFKFNTHNDNFLVKTELTKSEIQYFTPIAEKLNDLGILMAGLDVIDNKIIEINVTSPCYFIKEINNAYKVSLEQEICDYLLTPTLLSL
ncbi:hypothetical protein IKB17_00035 [bacterium]|nr:hypothetical protein [bacterium]